MACRLASVVIGLVCVLVGGRVAGANPESRPGWARYDRLCLACHGRAGDGAGPGAPFLTPPPRDFTRGEFAYRSTAWGQPATDDDVRAVIADGVPGTAMPAFAASLTAPQIAELVAIVRAFGPHNTPTTAIVLGTPPTTNRARGEQLWDSLGCAKCHGASGRGDGPAARGLPIAPYDLGAQPLRHRGRTSREAAAWAIATGMTGTPMPGYAGAIPDDDVWALADHVVALQGTPIATDRIDPLAIARDRAAPYANGTWPGSGDPDGAIWATIVAPQGPPPPALAPPEASLSADACGRCHAAQFRAWSGSLHREAARTPGFAAQTFALSPAARASCRKCHSPLAEQLAPDEAALASQGATCAGCHVRAWTRNGPPNISPALHALARPGYPSASRPIYERSDFCMPCHQLAPRTAVAGRPLLDTYREWLASPYMARGTECQDCHMRDREHAWRGIHDAPTVRAAFATTFDVRRTAAGSIGVIAELRNTGAGHDLPTTATPALVLTVELLDAHAAPIPGARLVYRIGRAIAFTADGWRETAPDTRIPPAGRVAISRAWFAPTATAARFTVVASPDDYYLALYTSQLAAPAATATVTVAVATPPPLPAARRALVEQALARAKADVFEVVRSIKLLPPP